MTLTYGPYETRDQLFVDALATPAIQVLEEVLYLFHTEESILILVELVEELGQK